MAYKFTGRIKKIWIESTDNYCEFDVDNTIKNGEEIYGVAVNENKQLDIVEEFKNIDKNIFDFLQSFHNERFEIEYDYFKKDKIGCTPCRKGVDGCYRKIIKVTVAK